MNNTKNGWLIKCYIWLCVRETWSIVEQDKKNLEAYAWVWTWRRHEKQFGCIKSSLGKMSLVYAVWEKRSAEFRLRRTFSNATRTKEKEDREMRLLEKRRDELNATGTIGHVHRRTEIEICNDKMGWGAFLLVKKDESHIHYRDKLVSGVKQELRILSRIYSSAVCDIKHFL